MKRTFLSIPFFLSSLVVAGCGGGGSSLPTGRVHTNLVNNGIYSNWTGATVYGNAVSFNCNISDPNCGLSGQGVTDGSGNYNFHSLAVPGLWSLAVQADSQCPTGTGASTQQLDPNVTVQLTCGSINQSTAYISPSSCSHQEYLDGTVYDDCPATLTATINGSSSFPTDHAMNVGMYNTGGTNIGSQNVAPASSTTLVLAAPTQTGETVVVIRDPNNNQVLLSSLFTKTFYREHCTPNTC